MKKNQSIEEVIIERESKPSGLSHINDVLPLPMIQLNMDVDVTNRVIYLTDIDLYTSVFVKQRADVIYQMSGDAVTPITISISCFGGDVYGMFGVIDVINHLPTKVNTLGIGTVQSAATSILACGTGTRKLTKNTIVMIHQINTWMNGQTEDVVNEVKHTRDLQNMLYQTLAARSNKSVEFWKKQSKYNLYLPATKCLEYGLIDEII